MEKASFVVVAIFIPLIRIIENNPITMIAVIGIALSIGVPIIEFSYRMRKITIDQMYSFPIKREKILK